MVPEDWTLHQFSDKKSADLAAPRLTPRKHTAFIPNTTQTGKFTKYDMRIIISYLKFVNL